MGFKLFIITTLYPDYLNSYYQKYPFIKDESYLTQYEHLLQDSSGSAISQSKMLNKLGNETTCCFTNVPLLQKSWLTENDFKEDNNSFAVLNQIKKNSPDVVWIDDTKFLSAEWINLLKKAVPSIKIIMGHYCTSYNAAILQKLKNLDFLLSCTPGLTNDFNNNGIKTYQVYHGFDTSILETVDDHNSFPETDLIFSGLIMVGGRGHNKRLEFIEKLIESDNGLKIYGDLETNGKIRSKQFFYYAINFIKYFGSEKLVKKIPILYRHEEYGLHPVKSYSKTLKQATHPAVFGLEMFKLLRKAKITFNIHGDGAGEYAGNMKLFEATGVGSCLVTDNKKNIAELFDTNQEIVIFNNVDECIEKINWLLNNEEERQKIAKKGQQRTLKDHTVEKRCELIIEIINKELRNKTIVT